MENPASSPAGRPAPAAPLPPGPSPEDLAAHITGREAELRQAMLAGDADQLAALLADEVLFIDQQGQVLTKAADLAAHRSGHLKLTHLLPLEQTLRVANAATVLVTVLMEVAGTYAGQPFAARCRYLRVWAAPHGPWQVVAGSVSGAA